VLLYVIAIPPIGDDSPGQHAKAHYEGTDHPVVILLEHPHPRWCYVHRRTI